MELDPQLENLLIRAALRTEGEVDFAFGMAKTGRFRVNVYRQRRRRWKCTGYQCGQNASAGSRDRLTEKPLPL